jgi:hypothetical protein
MRKEQKHAPANHPTRSSIAQVAEIQHFPWFNHLVLRRTHYAKPIDHPISTTTVHSFPRFFHSAEDVLWRKMPGDVGSLQRAGLGGCLQARRLLAA